MKTDIGLQDIQGLDAISWWPLAPGWWIVAAIVTSAALIGTTFYFWRLRKRRSWQYEVSATLDRLEHSLTKENSQATAIQLSELVRRLAIHLHSREECAALQGEAWLNWLAQEDRTHFAWPEIARSLIEAPFSPQGSVFDQKEILKTINAAKKWVQ